MRAPSAVELARKIVGMQVRGDPHYSYTHADSHTVATAYIKACEALEKAADQFEGYAKGHRVKARGALTLESKDDYRHKAETNEAMAAMCRDALSCSAPQVETGGSRPKDS